MKKMGDDKVDVETLGIGSVISLVLVYTYIKAPPYMNLLTIFMLNLSGENDT